MKISLSNGCIAPSTITYIPVHVGGVLQFPLVKHEILGDPVTIYPSLQVYATVFAKVVLDGFSKDPLEMEGGDPQSTTTKQMVH